MPAQAKALQQWQMVQDSLLDQPIAPLLPLTNRPRRDHPPYRQAHGSQRNPGSLCNSSLGEGLAATTVQDLLEIGQDLFIIGAQARRLACRLAAHLGSRPLLWWLFLHCGLHDHALRTVGHQ